MYIICLFESIQTIEMVASPSESASEKYSEKLMLIAHLGHLLSLGQSEF